MANKKPAAGLGRTWVQGEKKAAIEKRTRQGNGRCSLAKGTRKLSRGQGR